MLSLKSLNNIMHAPAAEPEPAAICNDTDDQVFDISQEDVQHIEEDNKSNEAGHFDITEDQLIRYAIQGSKKCLVTPEKYFNAFASDHGKDQSFINLCLSHQYSAK